MEMNYRRALSMDIPLVRLPVDPMNLIWLIMEPSLWRLLDRLPFSWGTFGRYSRRGWRFHDKRLRHIQESCLVYLQSRPIRSIGRLRSSGNPHAGSPRLRLQDPTGLVERQFLMRARKSLSLPSKAPFPLGLTARRITLARSLLRWSSSLCWHTYYDGIEWRLFVHRTRIFERRGNGFWQ